jgi:hypothetical protein
MDNIQRKNLTNSDGKNTTVSQFIVLSSKDLENSDWLSDDKFLQINEKFVNDEPVNFILKDFKDTNVDEGVIGHGGKALSLSIADDNIVIKIYKSSKKNDWKISHEYNLCKETYDAYVLCIKNDIETVALEKKAKNDKKFDLKLA